MRSRAVLPGTLAQALGLRGTAFYGLALVGLAWLATAPFPAGNSQVTQLPGQPPRPSIPIETLNGYADGVRSQHGSMQNQEDAKRIEQLNDLRHREMTSETERLVKLAKELKADSDKNASSAVSMSGVQKTEQIEKLARSIRDRMRAIAGN